MGKKQNPLKTAFRAFDRVGRAAQRATRDLTKAPQDKVFDLSRQLRYSADPKRAQRWLGDQLELPSALVTSYTPGRASKASKGLKTYTGHVEYTHGGSGDVRVLAYNKAAALKAMRRQVELQDPGAWVDAKSVNTGNHPKRSR